MSADMLPLLLPTVTGRVHGIVSLDPLTVQCDGCAKRESGRLAIITSGIRFNPLRYRHDQRRLCRDCAKTAGWEVRR